ncbi:Protein HYPER-SENSITIVITY-RELATED 4 [Camellia lanceoleosa]|uniref:Protein HYPER-SENSITIVITY-RELATED 4 n=1 Tax=Camellia lanceoleosa TaxID=1840588 RepID=A0ACC0HSV8_9ERIC|nr:Protein HYPER-SENSITIVITY-RELATED 4 [Camellia lanceoleosa]
MPSAKTVVTTAASIAASAMLVRSIVRDLVPLVLIIEEFDGLVGNQIYKAAQIYLGSKISLNTQLYKTLNPSKLCTRINTQPRHHDQKIGILNSYFPFILKEAMNLKDERKALKMHNLNNAHVWMYSGMSYTWDSINLDYPSTFETLAMDAEMKRMVKEDLERFVRRKDFYWRLGNAGTCSNRCVLLVEDIDCSIDLEDQREVLRMLQSNEVRHAQTINIVREKKENQARLLNFIDGLWSSCGDERIIMFTTNHKERLDLARLCPGRWMCISTCLIAALVNSKP